MWFVQESFRVPFLAAPWLQRDRSTSPASLPFSLPCCHGHLPGGRALRAAWRGRTVWEGWVSPALALLTVCNLRVCLSPLQAAPKRCCGMDHFVLTMIVHSLPFLWITLWSKGFLRGLGLCIKSWPVKHPLIIPATLAWPRWWKQQE